MPAQNVFVQWSPGKTPKIQKRTKLGRPRDIQRALEESTRAIITPDGWKLCLRDKDLNELYNLRADPYELHNLFGRTEHKEIASRLAGEIHQWQENAGDPIDL
jgi:arylsulfatase A-like enzyme